MIISGLKFLVFVLGTVFVHSDLVLCSLPFVHPLSIHPLNNNFKLRHQMEKLFRGYVGRGW